MLFRSSLLLTLIVGSLFLSCVIAVDPEEFENNRQGKIFSRKFWNGFEKGIKDTAQIFTRVSDNLEVAFDQIATDFNDTIATFANKIERRVGNPLHPYYQREDLGMSPSEPVGGIVEDFAAPNGGVDDGLEVDYPVEGEEIEGAPVSSSTDSMSIPRPGEDYGLDTFNPFGPLGGNGGGLFNIFRRRKPWWQGENVCVDREEIDDTESNTNESGDAEVNTKGFEPNPINGQIFGFFSNLQTSTCRDTGEKYTCVTSTNRRGLHKTVRVSYRCCHGFVRDGVGCSKIDILPMPETLEALEDTTDFLSLVKAADLTELLTEKNLTVFVPNNEAIAEYTADLEEKNEIQNNIDGLRNNIYRRKRNAHNLSPILLSHMTEGFVYAGDLSDEKVLNSLNENSTIRVNVYQGYPPSVTVNCARIVTANQHSINGVLHTIDRVIEPVTKSIADVVASDPQFSILKKLLSSSGLVEEMRGDGQYTLLAPTDAAFRRLDPLILESLIDGGSCLEAVMKQHILPNTICSTAIQGKMKTLTELEEFLVVERTEDDKLFVDDAQIVARDIMGTNGVVHIIDKALVPNEAKSVKEVLEYHNLTRFMELLELAELADEFNSQKDITVFAPSNKAVDSIPDQELNLLKGNKERLREVLRYHMTTPSITASNINNNQLVDTSAGHPLRINLYSSAPVLSGLFRVSRRRPMRVTAGCSRVSMLDSRACGAVVHIVEDMFQVPKSNVLGALQDEQFSIFKQMVHDTGFNTELEGEGPYTVLAPSDHAFKTLPEEELEQILKDEELKRKLVQNHIMQEHVCCSGINSNNWLFMDRKRTMGGNNIHIRRSPNGRLMAGPARIIECGSPTSNGVVHTINRMVVNDRDMNDMMGKRKGGVDMRIFPIPQLKEMFVI